MNSNAAVSKAPPGLSVGSEATALRLHDGTASAVDGPRFRVPPLDAPEMHGVWREILDEFLDRRAVHRFQYYAESHAGYRWKPKLALILPEDFSAERPAHRHDLSVALEVLASVMDLYNIDIVSDSPDACPPVPQGGAVLARGHLRLHGRAGAAVALTQRRGRRDPAESLRRGRPVRLPNQQEANRVRGQRCRATIRPGGGLRGRAGCPR